MSWFLRSGARCDLVFGRSAPCDQIATQSQLRREHTTERQGTSPEVCNLQLTTTCNLRLTLAAASVLRYGPFFPVQKRAYMTKKSSPSLAVRVLRRILKTPSILGFLAVLPILTEGTSFHDTAVSLRTYGALGILNYEAFAWWATRAIGWFEAKRMDWDRDPRFFLTGLLALPFATIWSYLAMRLFEHPGEWKVIFTEFSGITLQMSVLVCSFGLLTCVCRNHGANTPIQRRTPLHSRSHTACKMETRGHFACDARFFSGGSLAPWRFSCSIG